MGVGRCLGLEGMEEGGFGASQVRRWVLMLVIFFAVVILIHGLREEEEPYL
jgi:hypothetical protein